MTGKSKDHHKESGSGELDYGNNRPTGGTDANVGKINPQGPTSGTANYNPDREKGQQTTAQGDSPMDDRRNAQDFTSTAHEVAGINAPGNFSTGPVSPNAGDVQDESGNLNPGASATSGAGTGDSGGHQSFRCADAGNADCRWETSSASSNELWADIERHGRDEHGIESLDEVSRGRIQNAIRTRRAA